MSILLSDCYIGKPIISLKGEELGVCKDVIFDKTHLKIEWLHVFDDKEEKEDYFLKASAVKSEGKVMILKKGEPQIAESAEKNNPINLPAYTTNGEFLGRIANVSLEEDKLRIRSVILNTTSGEKDILKEKIFSVGKDAVLINLNKTKKAPQKKRVQKHNEIKIEDFKLKNEEKFYNNFSDSVEVPILTMPSVSIANPQSLIGKRVMRDIQNQKGEIIIKSGSIVSEKILQEAKKYGRLYALAIASLSNIY